MSIGKQENGESPFMIKAMACRAIDYLQIDTSQMVAADVGCGIGELTDTIKDRFCKIEMLDYGTDAIIPSNGHFAQCDLNNTFPIADNSIDFFFSLEVIEHLENPRHFFREIARVMKTASYGFVTTPNNESFFSKLNFLLSNNHRYFSDNCYPAHITAVLQIEIKRILNENGLTFIKPFYTNSDVVPKLNKKLPFLGGKLFSGNFGMLFKK